MSEPEDWPLNYFNYFTEIEEHFQRARGTGLFLLSPLDWALIESWKNDGVPLEAVLQGIDEAFVKWHSRKQKRRQVNSIAYCAQAISQAAERASSRSSGPSAQAPFSEDELRSHLTKGSEQLRSRPEAQYHDIAAALDALSTEAAMLLSNVEDLERRLTALEDKMVATARALLSDDALYAMRESLDNELRPYRSAMNAGQLAILERRYLDTAVLEHAKLPRLSLFYLR